MEVLAMTYPGMFLKTTEEFSSSMSNGIWTSAENGDEAKDGFNLFDYYSENYKRYDLGVHVELVALLEKHGWYAEYYDGGTAMLWPE